MTTQELNFIFRSLGERGNLYRKFLSYTLRSQTEFLNKMSANDIIFRPYGSAAEGLLLYDTDFPGDIDLVIFPNSDDLIIHKEMIKYLPEHPMHVRIKGVDHPVLQSCLVEDSEYVATSALKNFHPAIYRRSSSSFNSCIFDALQLIATREKPVPLSVGQIKTNATSPALTLNLSPSFWNFGSIPNRKDRESVETKKGDRNDSQNDPKPRTQSFREKREQSCNLQRTPEEENKELPQNLSTMVGMYIRAFEYVLGIGSNANEGLSQETKSKNAGGAKLEDMVVDGTDFVPAFRSRGWPEVAREWIKRERKWPSPEVVDRVIQEGFHLVVKPPKNGGNPDCDFRISFSEAEYLLSQEMNDTQRDCYRCLKKFHRVYLSTEPKGLVSFHLKNLLLQTIEETGAEMWTESNRTECMMKLVKNLLEALTKKDLRHFFVRSYNLFGGDYIESPEILESLARKVEPIIDNPRQIAQKLILCEKDERGSSRTRTYNLKEWFLATSKGLCDMALDAAFSSSDPVERSLVEDLRERLKNNYCNFKVLLKNESDKKRRILLCFQALQDVSKMCKYFQENYPQRVA